MQHDDLFTVEQLCDFAGLRYGMLFGNDRMVHLVSGGGHRKSKDLFIDLDLVPAATDQRWRVLYILETLAVDLDCYEAGESLVCAGLADAQINGGYTRRPEGLPHAFDMNLWPNIREYNPPDPVTYEAVKFDVQMQMCICLMNSSDRISYILTRESMLGFDRGCVDACLEALDRWEPDRDSRRGQADCWRALLREPIPVIIATMLETSEQGQFIRTAHPQYPMTFTQARRSELLEAYFAETRALGADPQTPDVSDVRISRLLLPEKAMRNERYGRPTKYSSDPIDFLRTK